MTKEKQIVLQVLELYRDMSYLWDKKHKDYNNRGCRNEGYRALLEVYKELHQNATLKTLTKKIQNLRTNYTKELKKVKESERNGDIYVPSVYYFDALSFLEASNEQCHSARDPLETEDMSSSSSSDAESDHQMTTSSLSPPQKRKRFIQESLLQKQDHMLNIAESLLKMKDNDWEVAGKAIGLQLRDLSKRQLIITQKIISDAIYYAKLGLLTEDSFVALTTPNTQNFPNPSMSTHGHQEPLPYHVKRSPQAVSSSSNRYYINSGAPLHQSPPPQQIQSPDSLPSTQHKKSPSPQPSP